MNLFYRGLTIVHEQATGASNGSQGHRQKLSRREGEYKLALPVIHKSYGLCLCQDKPESVFCYRFKADWCWAESHVIFFFYRKSFAAVLQPGLVTSQRSNNHKCWTGKTTGSALTCSLQMFEETVVKHGQKSDRTHVLHRFGDTECLTVMR